MEVETPLSYPRGRLPGKGDGRQGCLPGERPGLKTIEKRK